MKYHNKNHNFLIDLHGKVVYNGVTYRESEELLSPAEVSLLYGAYDPDLLDLFDDDGRNLLVLKTIAILAREKARRLGTPYPPISATNPKKNKLAELHVRMSKSQKRWQTVPLGEQHRL